MREIAKKELVNTQIITLYREIMRLLDIPVDNNSEETPRRVANMLQEVFENVGKDPIECLSPQISVFPAQNSNIVTVKDIPVVSYCAHHHLPFVGKAKVSYVPNKVIIGLSKIPRIVEWFSKKPQLQEYLTNEIGEFLVQMLDPIKIEVEIYDASHTCMTCRGIKSIGTTDTHFVAYKHTNEGIYTPLSPNIARDDSVLRCDISIGDVNK